MISPISGIGAFVTSKKEHRVPENRTKTASQDQNHRLI